jgi:hypothetical protein
MSRTYRALTTLALGLALVATTAAVAGAAEDANAARKALYESELAHNLAGQAARSQAARTEAAVERARALERQAAVTAQPVAEDQNDRLLRGIEAAQAGRTQASVEQARAGERNLVPVVTIAAPQPIPAAPGRDVDVVAIVLLSLLGGLIGGAAVVAGTAANRRRHRVVAA